MPEKKESGDACGIRTRVAGMKIPPITENPENASFYSLKTGACRIPGTCKFVSTEGVM